MSKKPKSDFKAGVPDEMQTPSQEIEETLPYEDKTFKKDSKNDYLEEYSTVPQTNRNFSQPLMFNDDKKDNLVIDLLKVDWERLEHIIRGHVPKVDKDGNEYFVKMDDYGLNEYGVNSILNVLSLYISKEIRLGRFTSEEVKNRMTQFSQQFTDWFYDNVEEFGMDTPEKKKKSKMLVHTIIDLVDASYSSAIEGKTIELLLKQFQVLQQEPIYNEGFNPNQHNPQKSKPTVMQRIFG